MDSEAPSQIRSNGHSLPASSLPRSTQRFDPATSLFQDRPLLDRSSRFTAIESRHSELQIINELIYRWCRILTRLRDQPTDTQLHECQRVLIIDLVGAISPFRLGDVLKKNERRLQLVGIVRSCKLNPTYVTLESYLSRRAPQPSLKLIVIYQDEFYVLKTISLINDYLQNHNKCQVVFVTPRLDRAERDVLMLNSNCQILRCDFCVSRREIGPAAPEAVEKSYPTYLNQVIIHRNSRNKSLPDKVKCELREDGLYLHEILERPAKKLKQYHGTNTSISSMATTR